MNHPPVPVQNKKICVQVLYRNWRGETAPRNIMLHREWYGSTEFHPHPQPMLKVTDLERNVERDFAINDILGWWLPGEELTVDLAKLCHTDILLAYFRVLTQKKNAESV